MIREIDIRREEVAEQVWYLQHAAYRIEAQAAGLRNPPPIRETAGELRSCGETFIGCGRAGDLAAVLSYRVSGGTLDIRRLMVDPSFLRQGIGERLLAHVLRGVPHRRAVVLVSEGNAPALALYRKLGFRERGRSEPLPGVGLLRFERENG